MSPDSSTLQSREACALPTPTRTRWQPLRLGLVELFHYDCEEFWFRDGHLLLRGNNGTGKSKVLSLTLPFLLDASLSPSRVEPDGDRSKRMEWNLLLGRHDRRVGYSWLELGRIDEAGTPQYVTLGCGMQAVAGRTRVDAWHFITRQRVGESLALITPRRTVLSREGLKEALGDAGRTYETVHEYRRAVDERLFQLGDRYDGLIDTLIQLRQPQLSKKPDERSLSEALSNALPELPRTVMEDVADAMLQLNLYRDELTHLEDVLKAISAFDKRYRVYAQIQARRQARVLRKAQTELDNQSHALREAEAQRSAAEQEVETREVRCRELDAELRRQRARLEELQADPAMLDARRLADLEELERNGQLELEHAQARLDEARTLQDSERKESTRRQAALEHAREERTRVERDVTTLADMAGLLSVHQQLMAAVPAEAVDTQSSGALQRDLRAQAQRRQEQLAQIRRLLAACAAAERERELAQQLAAERRGTLERAQQQVRSRKQQLDTAAQQLLAAYRIYLAELRVLVLPDPEAALAELESWVETLYGEQPVLQQLSLARREAETQLATEQSALARLREELAAEQELLRKEELTLRAGDQPTPPALPMRSVDARVGRAGAPFWQLLEYREHVSAVERAGIEAALEGSGLLDAWVTPDGSMLQADGSDAWLQRGAPCASALGQWVTAADGDRVERAVVEALLACIRCDARDDRQADSWLSPAGDFRLGRLQGSHHKSEAQYVGWAAREAARLRRLAQVRAALEALEARSFELQAQSESLAARQALLTKELRAQPGDDALRGAHAHLEAAELQRRDAQERCAEAESRLEYAGRQLQAARSALEADARDLQLPTEPEALARIEEAVLRYIAGIAALRGAMEAHARCFQERSRQALREQRAASEVEARARETLGRERQLADTRARLALLRETALAAVTELQHKLSATRQALRDADGALEVERTQVADARGRWGGICQRVEDCVARLELCSEERRHAVERVQGFVATGLLSLALPQLELPERASWGVDATLQVARRIEEQLVKVSAEDHDWARIQSAISQDFTDLGAALSALGQRTQMEQSDYGLLVEVIYQNRPERPDVLERVLADEVEQRRGVLSAREREVLENHLQSEVAAHLQRLLVDAEARVERINQELKRRPTSTGVYFKLEWEALAEGDGGAPTGLQAARTRLLRRSADAWSPEDRRVVGAFLQARIASEREQDDTSPLVEHLARALDYRRWHGFRVKRWHDGAFRPLSGPASSGERALGLTVPLFAAASSHYASANSPHAPRLVLLDEAFAGIDDEARAHCMALIREFDLDFVMTSEREWGCYASLPGVAICQIIRREGVDGVFVSRWTWDGRARRSEPDPTRRFESAASDDG